jgi:cytoskeleton protein RodZ
MAEDFGSYLKSERELRGVTLEELNSKTRIPSRYLQALENNQFDELPEEVFIRGYLRSISHVIGAQEDEVLSTYMDIKKTAPSIGTENSSTLNQKHSTLDPKFIFVLILTVLFLSGITWGISILVHKFNKDSIESTSTLSKQKQNNTKENPVNNLSAGNAKTSDTSTALTTSKLASITSAIDSKVSIENLPNILSTKPTDDLKNLSAAVNNEDPDEELNQSVLVDIAGKENISGASVPPKETNIPLTLTIRAKGDVWFNIKVDDSPVDSFVLTEGSEKVFYGEKQYLLNAGNKNLIDLTLNGSAINFPKANKEDIVTNFTINAQLVE